MEFGELIEPTTRAFWNNYDEFEEENRQPAQPTALQWKWMDKDGSGANSIKSVKNLFIFEFEKIVHFVQSTILKETSPLCQIDGGKTSVYKLQNSDDYIVICEDTSLEQTGPMTEMLLPWLEKAEIVYMFPVYKEGGYIHSEETDLRCFIRTVSNTDVEKLIEPITAAMEDCNIIYGLSAGVSTWRHIHKLPFICYTVYMDCMEIEPWVASYILRLLNKLGLKCDKSYVPKLGSNSFLYI